MFRRLLIVAPLAMLVTLAIFMLLKGVLFPSPEMLTQETVESVSLSPKKQQDEPERAKPSQQAGTREQETSEYYIPDSPALPIVRVPPEYPAGCGVVRGEVVVEFYVDAEGRILNAKIVSSTSPCFVSAVLSVLPKWQYRPRVENGEPVRSRRQRVVVEFIPE